MNEQLVKYFKSELDRSYNLITRAYASMETIQDCLDIAGIYKNNKDVREKIHAIQQNLECIHVKIEKFKFY